MKSSVFSFFVLALFLFTSCDKEKVSDDAQLIAAIQAATDKQEIAINDLPSSSKTTLESDFKESFVQNKLLAPGLGYEITMRRGEGSFVGEPTAVYFNLDGRKLISGKYDKEAYDKGEDKEGYDKEDCFKYIYPIDFTMPDGTTAELSADEKGENWDEIKAWYKENPTSKGKIEAIYPLQIQLDETTIETVNNETEMIEWKKSCE